MFEPKCQALPSTLPFDRLIDDIKTGKIQIPYFQRDFVWKPDDTAKLLDSIFKGYPIGTIVFWDTKEPLATDKGIGEYLKSKTKDDESHLYVIDGQQRLSSIFFACEGIYKTKKYDYSKIFVVIKEDKKDYDEEERIVVYEEPDDGKFKTISIKDLLNATSDDLKEYTGSEVDIINAHKTRIKSALFPIITISHTEMDVACDIFSRINTSGRTLTLFEIMVARTYDGDSFNLLDKYKELEDSFPTNFNSPDKKVLLHSVVPVAYRLENNKKWEYVSDKSVLSIPRELFQRSWKLMIASLKDTIDFLRDGLRIKTSEILPYPSMIVPLVYYFDKYGKYKMSAKQQKLLEQWFYWFGVNQKAIQGASSQTNASIKMMDEIYNGNAPVYEKIELEFDYEKIECQELNYSSALCKSVLCILSQNSPKKLNADVDVNLDADFASLKNQKNDHHFFPQALFKNDKKYKEKNHKLISNIIFIDNLTNLQIGKKEPSDYISELASLNNNIKENLLTHFVDLDDSLIMKNNYDKFIKSRSKLIAKAINEKLNPFEEINKKLKDAPN